MMLGRRRWRRPDADELAATVRLLETWPAPDGGVVRHLFPLAAIGSGGAGMTRLTGDPADVRADGSARLGVVVRVGRDVLAVCGDAQTVARATGPGPTWRLLVGERTVCTALLGPWGSDDRIVHEQRLLLLDPASLPGEDELADPGRRPGLVADLDALARLAVQLHVDDGFGPDPGPAGSRGYRARLVSTVAAGGVDVVGPAGSPVAKLERSVDDVRLGVQFAGIVVHPAHRGQGLGRGLVAAAARAALAATPTPRPITLHTRVSNTAALRTYGAVGFRGSEDWCLAVRP
jgi:ribosomal protein S18 acetylase RimI-like enzyme